MKILIPLSAFLLPICMLICSAPAQAQSFKPGDIAISAGYGGPYVTFDESVDNINGTGYTKATPAGPMYLKIEYALTNHISMGLNIAYVRASMSRLDSGYLFNPNAPTYQAPILYTYTSQEVYSSLSVLARLNYHFITNSKLDPYMGVGIGYRNGITKYTPNDGTNSFIATGQNIGTNFPLGFELTIGARYYFSKQFGIYVELGAAKSPIQGGIVLKFNTPQKQTKN